MTLLTDNTHVRDQQWLFPIPDTSFHSSQQNASENYRDRKLPQTGVSQGPKLVYGHARNLGNTEGIPSLFQWHFNRRFVLTTLAVSLKIQHLAQHLVIDIC